MPLYLIDTVTLPDNSLLRAVAVGVWPSDSPRHDSWEGLCVVGPGPALVALADALEATTPIEASIGTIRVTRLVVADWPEGGGDPPYRCRFVAVGAPRGELAEMIATDRHFTAQTPEK